MESHDVGENFQIIASSMPYFENYFQLCIEISGIIGKPHGHMWPILLMGKPRICVKLKHICVSKEL
jgi:hypothetical protein